MLVEINARDAGQMIDVDIIMGGPNHLPPMTECFVFVTRDPQTGNEGIAGAYAAGVWMPLVTSDKSQLDLQRAMARRIARASGHKVTLIRFSQREDLETIE